MFRDYLRRAYRTLIPYIYAKRNYKMFLQKSFVNLDDRIRSLICATDAFSSNIKPIQIKAPFGKSMLVLAPHQDDEIIGCGGAMLLQLSVGKNLNIVFIQDGGDEYIEKGLTRKKLVQIREKESRDVAKEMGIPPPRFLKHTKLTSTKIAVIASELKEEIARTNCDVIFVPFFLDTNYDHRMTNRALAEALSGLKGKMSIYCYEVWGLCIPNVILNIDKVMETKKKLLSKYVSQLASTDYLNSTIGLNMYHSRSFEAGVCKYAERFFEMPSEDYFQIVKKICVNK